MSNKVEAGNTCDMPLVSVCIPVYNNADTIIETIESIMNQTYSNIEILIADDRSQDNSYEVINDYILNKDNNPRFAGKSIALERNEKNLGMSGNWNHCLEMCNGKYIKLICGDDLIHETLIAREVEIMEQHPEVNLVQTDTRFIDMNGNGTGFYRRYHKSGVVDGVDACKFSIFTRDYLGAPLANLIRKSAYDAWGGFDPEFSFIIDYDFCMKLCSRGKIYILHEPLNYFRIRNDSNTSQVMNGEKGKMYIDEHRRLVEKYADELGLKPWQVNLSVLIRRITIALGGIYLKIFVK